MTYYEQLKHPLWQKKRLEIMERDGFKCLECGDGERTLNVHHCYYQSGIKVWEYPDFSLKTLCEDCHEARHDIEKSISSVLSGLTIDDLNLIFCDVLYAVSMNGVKPVSDFCRTLPT